MDLMQNVKDKQGFISLSNEQKWKKLKSIPKPARPQNGYIRFVADYMRSKSKANTRVQDIMIEAANAWRHLPDDQKIKWSEACKKGKEAYQQNANEYKRAKKAMKKPASGFALFVKDKWRAEKGKTYPRGRKPKFSEIHKRIVKEWKKLSENDRQKYLGQARRSLSLYQAERQAVINGEKEFNIDWNEEEMEQEDA